MNCNSITKVVYHDAPKYPFSVTFVSGSEAAAADPEAITGVHIDFGDKQFVACVSPDDELLVFNVNHETSDDEKERLGVKPLTSTTTMKQVPGFQGQLPVIDETYPRAWSCSANNSPSQEDEKRIREILVKAL